MTLRRTDRARRWMCALLALTLLMAGIALPDAARADTDVSAAPMNAAAAPEDGMVRVWLSLLGSPTKLNLTVKGSYTVNGQTAKALSSGTALTVSMNSATGQLSLTAGGSTSAMGRSFALRRHATSGSNGILISQSVKPSNPYPGDVTFTAQKQSSGAYRLYVIASIYIESYLYGVVPYEMGNSAHLEALKAQAVAARTYTLRKMRARASSLYDVTDTTTDQVYYGTPTSGTANCAAAVDATKGIVVMNNGALTGTYYTASNGGQTEASRNIWGGTGYAYLSVKDDPFDYDNADSRVKTATIYASATNASQNAKLMALLRTKAVAALKSAGYAATADNTALLSIGDVTLHTPKYKSPSRLYTKMDFQLSARTVSSGGSAVVASTTVTCGVFTELESILSLSVNSTQNELWTVTKSGGNFVVQARRYGHGVGMSQRGAMQMGKLGYSYAHVLAFYYPGCTRVRYTFTHTILSAVSSGGGETVTTVETPAEAPDNDAPAYATVKLSSATAVLAVRREASLSAAAVGMVPHGVPVGVYAKTGGFCFIIYGEVRGWVPQDALALAGDVPASTTLAASDGTIVGYAKVTCSGTLNLRASGSSSGKILCTVRSGAVLPVLSRTSGLARVQYGTLTAWASADFLTITAEYPGTVSNTAARLMTVMTSDGTGTVNLRKSASTQAVSLAQVRAGTTVTQTQSDGVWSAVTVGGVSGYMMASFLREAGESGGSGSGSEGSGSDGSGSDDSGSGSDGAASGGLADGEVEAIVASEKSSLNLRQKPSTNSTILLEIPKGESIVVTKRGVTWCAVRYSGLTGHVMTMYLRFPSDDADADGEEPQETTAPAAPETTVPAAPEVSPEPTGGDADAPVNVPLSESYAPTAALVDTPSGSLNLRAAPKDRAKILRTIPKGTRVTIDTHDVDWTGVTYRGVSGYVMSRYLIFLNDAPATNAPDTGTTPDTGASPDIGTTPDTGTSPDTGTTPETDTASEGDTGDADAIENPLQMWVYTESGSLNLRDAPDGRVLTTIPQFAAVDVLSVGNTWCRVRRAGVVGYVKTVFLVDAEPTAPPTPNTSESGESSEPDESPAPAVVPDTPAARDAWVVTGSGSLNLRESRSRDAAVLTTVPRLARVSVSDEDGTWAAVRYGGHDGFVMTKYLSFKKPKGASSADSGSASSGGGSAASGSGSTAASDSASSGDSAPVYDSTLTPVTNMIALVDSTSSTLNLRNFCSTTGSTILAEMPRDTQIDVLERGKTWCKVAFERGGASIAGYCLTAYLFFPNDE